MFYGEIEMLKAIIALKSLKPRYGPTKLVKMKLKTNWCWLGGRDYCGQQEDFSEGGGN